ncbi:peroxisomal membrane protein 2-like [Acanthaster planci]|uniref:Peroxisomal membrane protein 2-like n=1 Tax=Acanthaster planci TaxID=133434 RepID=A0A8B7YR88_ACAPL|nr:peroxisomal membrane protein 2-like [Acanthaster planci]
MSVRFSKEDATHKRLLAEYLRLLRTYPIITKSLTSGAISSISNIVAQKLTGGWKRPIDWRNIGAFAATGVFYTGPVMHNFYRWLEAIVPGKDKTSQILKVIFDRLFIAPPFLLGYLYLIRRFEGKTHKVAVEFLKQAYWTVLKLNWKVWTIIQYININFVPLQYRVIFASAVAFIWTLYIAVISGR